MMRISEVRKLATRTLHESTVPRWLSVRKNVVICPSCW